MDLCVNPQLHNQKLKFVFLVLHVCNVHAGHFILVMDQVFVIASSLCSTNTLPFSG